MLGFCVFLLATNTHANYIQLMAEQLVSKYILWITSFTCLIAIDINLFLLRLKTDITLIFTLETIKNFPEPNFREAIWSLILTKDFFKQMWKKMWWSHLYWTPMCKEVFFPPQWMHQYPWMLSQTINNILFKSKCNLASSYQGKAHLTSPIQYIVWVTWDNRSD